MNCCFDITAKVLSNIRLDINKVIMECTNRAKTKSNKIISKVIIFINRLVQETRDNREGQQNSRTVFG